MVVVTSESLYTPEEYLYREERSKSKHEYVNGKIIPMPGASVPHNLITVNVITALKSFLKKGEKKYFVMGSDIKIGIQAFTHFRYPDAVVVCEEIKYYGSRTDVIINPLLIVEVLSTGTESVDRGVKFDDYKTLSSFKEYVLISQEKPYVSTYFREEEDLWRTKVVEDLEASVNLRSIGCEIALTDIYDQIEFVSSLKS